MEEFDDERILSNKCDIIHLRSNKIIGKRTQENLNSFFNEAEWDKSFNLSVNNKINELNIKYNLTIEENYLNKEFKIKFDEFKSEKIKEISEEKYLCIICEKVKLKSKKDVQITHFCI